MSLSSKKIFTAASTKWNFINFKPGLVGGHCIGVDPYYLTYKAKKIGISPKVILSGRKINDDMSKYVFLKILTYKKKIKKALFFGCTFKENVSDVRNSKVFDLAKLFKKNRIPFDVYDPIANLDNKVKKIYNFTSSVKNLKEYDLIVFAIKHKEFLKEKIKSIIKKNVNSQAVIIDLCDITENLKIKSHYKL
jgi:UDP-N-acetyl-D-galactosamine dehydrogenase